MNPVLDGLTLADHDTPSRRESRGKDRRRAASSVASESECSVPHLFDCWESISKKIRAARDIRLFLDFDGTLAPYSGRPEDVKLSGETRKVLARLRRHQRVHVAIVSGRRNDALRKLVPVPGIQLLGLFGWERRGRPPLPRKSKKILRGLRPVLAPLPELFPGIHLEDKGVSYAIHFRGASAEAQQRVRIWIQRLLARIHPDFHMIQSNHACEIVPRQVRGKGAAMREWLHGLRPLFLPIYVGDDLTDEPAFAALRRGITVRVAPFLRTRARFRLENPQEVHTFLERMEEELC